MTVMPPSMTAAERYLALLQSGDTRGASVYLEQLADDTTVDPWAIVEHLGHKLTRPTRRPAERTADDNPLQVPTDTQSVWNEALGASGVFGRR